MPLRKFLQMQKRLKSVQRHFAVNRPAKRFDVITVAMYFKCGNMEDAVKFFDLMTKHHIVSWNCLISGHVLHRNGVKALYVWSKMEEMGMKPESLTFMLILRSVGPLPPW
ncbi:hypothetical protein MKW94_025426 [Papaver nudicaule]|uniref:Pentatricopeptide repeat-containing protein n=1 Tax=Papaver nudicaule TaxID=74823 RepID=A0AA41S617_PAPNU|nr:hypothetical protein [Papaver nudicaule]